jgi:hypothetical protein
MAKSNDPKVAVKISNPIRQLKLAIGKTNICTLEYIDRIHSQWDKKGLEHPGHCKVYKRHFPDSCLHCLHPTHHSIAQKI